jgi:hypothetical protein
MPALPLNVAEPVTAVFGVMLYPEARGPTRALICFATLAVKD